MARPSASIAAVLITAAAVSVSVSTPATAAPAEVTIQGIGQQVTVHSGIVQADLKPIPGTAAPNTGLFKQGDKAAIYCFLADNRGVWWVLAVNLSGHAGQQYANTAGFVRDDAIRPEFAGGVDCGAS